MEKGRNDSGQEQQFQCEVKVGGSIKKGAPIGDTFLKGVIRYEL
jgi:hypothetical protein